MIIDVMQCLHYIMTSNLFSLTAEGKSDYYYFVIFSISHFLHFSMFRAILFGNLWRVENKPKIKFSPFCQ